MDIGITDELADIMVEQTSREGVAALVPRRSREAHKYSAGAVLVVAGSPSFAGAPRLAALGAARAGAGLITVATGRTTHPLVATSLVEATFIILDDDGLHGDLQPAQALERIRGVFSRYRCVLIGPGLGQEKGTQETVYALAHALRDLPEQQRPRLLVDADGLNALSERERWWELLPPRSILTPHAGELARLRKAGRQEQQTAVKEEERLEVARRLSAEWGHIVVLKGAHTIIAAPDGRVAINTTGGPNLASAGTGDVLGGIIAGLAAQGAGPFEAAVAGVYLHGAAGDELAQRRGDRGTLAGDLPEVLPEILRTVLSGTG